MGLLMASLVTWVLMLAPLARAGCTDWAGLRSDPAGLGRCGSDQARDETQGSRGLLQTTGRIKHPD